MTTICDDVLCLIFSFCDLQTRLSILRAYRKQPNFPSTSLDLFLRKELEVEISKDVNRADVYSYIHNPNSKNLSRLFKHNNSKSVCKSLARYTIKSHTTDFVRFLMIRLRKTKEINTLNNFLRHMHCAVLK